MPAYWYSIRENKANAENVSAERQKLNEKIVASHKPYFMQYVYPLLRSEEKKWIDECNIDSLRKFGVEIDDESLKESDEGIEFLKFKDRGLKTGSNPCTVNRICWIFEKEFPNASVARPEKDFDYTILKSDTDYSERDFDAIEKVYKDYRNEFNSFRQQIKDGNYEKNDDLKYTLELFKQRFKGECSRICPNEQELCNIILDLCYTKECLKQFAWDIVGDVIVDNLIKRNGSISFPVRNGNEFEFGGKTFDMVSIPVNDDEGVMEE